MTISDKAIRARSYEDANLNGVLSLHGAGRSIPSHIRVRENSSVISISSSGRVNELSQRVTFTDIINWIDKNFEKIQNGNSNEFLDSFAKRIDLNEIIASGVEPNSILIETSTLINALENNNIYFYRSKSKKVCIKDGFKNKLILGLEKIYDLSKLSDANANLFQVNGLGKNNVLKINKKTISIEINILKRLNIEDDGKELSLQDYIKKHKLYSVTFTDPQYMYFMGYCFQDRSGISDIDNILDILVNQDNFTVKAEKEPEDEFLTENSTQFSSNSIFGFVENLHRKDDYIFCDDLGDEWADHITMNLKDKSINFIHSKYNDDVSLSASKLHDVVGQAIKNIGNMHFSRDQFINKKLNPKLMKVYTTSNSVRTNISRVRKGNLKDFESKLDSLLKNHSLSRKCILCCPFLSKEQIGNEFKKIKQGKNTKGNVTQLLWIISSFSHVVKEMNIVPVIYCRS
ncbi:hypothetical protein C8D76_11533 [Pasteurella langaaensis DSM 22999]|uniref:Uncharacterized protein n=1 Tax=Alitibacter langaaensis DSM 22999 TaxID=1122935 RepID=A0A2U0SLD0_9PAST|nr:hypothetical protein [Pasteurella langaaensis]PVX32130.1 hypothetical protein C8D76_11533 [Pasteurella langaaensis DSM 22999]